MLVSPSIVTAEGAESAMGWTGKQSSLRVQVAVALVTAISDMGVNSLDFQERAEAIVCDVT